MKKNILLGIIFIALCICGGCDSSRDGISNNSTNGDLNIEDIDSTNDNNDIVIDNTEDGTITTEEDIVPEIEYEDYTGDIPHIFLHCLIAYPELKNGAGMMRYDTDCINVTEFKNLLNELYNNGYCLIDIYDTYNVSGTGELTLADSVSVPVGKKPFILTVDDVVYDVDKRGNGMVDFLDIDEEENIVACTYLEDGTVDKSYDNEIFPILETFIYEHPDFSANGSRVTLCMTGFTGVFGYRTDADYMGDDKEDNIKKATEIANRFKELGYTFASHSYGHYDHTNYSVGGLTKDLQSFQDEVVPIIGEVGVYVYPYGKLIKPEDARYKVMQDYGFQMFCSVSHTFFRREYDSLDTLYMTRVAVDGYSLRNYKQVLSPLFDTEKVIDYENRP